MAKAKKRLFDLKALEVSFVPRGANKRKLLLTKEDEMDEILKELLGSKFENEAELDERIEKSLPEEIRKNADELEKAKVTMKAALKLLQGVGKQLPKGADGIMQSMQELMGGKKKEVQKEAPSREEILKQLADEGYKIEAPKKEDPEMKEGITKEDLDRVLKERDEKHEKVLKEMRDDREKIAKELEHEKSLRITKEFEDEARAMGYHGDRVSEIAKVLKESKENMSEESYKAVRKQLEQNTEIGDGNVFKELGSGAGGDRDVIAKIDGKVEEIMKADPKLSREQAEDRLMAKEPALYNEYLKANPSQGGY